NLKPFMYNKSLKSLAKKYMMIHFSCSPCIAYLLTTFHFSLFTALQTSSFPVPAPTSLSPSFKNTQFISIPAESVTSNFNVGSIIPSAGIILSYSCKILTIVYPISTIANCCPIQILGPPLNGMNCHGLGVQPEVQRSGWNSEGS